MPEVRFPIKDRFNEEIEKVCKKLGITKAEYVKSLIINDLSKRGGEKKNE